LEYKLVFRKIDKNLLVLCAGLIIGGGLGLFFNIFLRENGSVDGSQVLGVFENGAGSLADNFDLETTTGKMIQLSDLEGKPVLVNFWATWCGPCQVEMPLIQKYYEKYTPGLEVLAINYDESIGDIQPYMKKLGLTFPVLLDPGGKTADLYRVRGFPTTYFIDREGFVRGVFVGILSKKGIEDNLKKIGVGK
jgi:cytochrome c biogenesis protein CcmG, thiol:disulfide interchange protein DsbE